MHRHETKKLVHASTYALAAVFTHSHTENLRVLWVQVHRGLGVAATRLDDRVREEAAATVRRVSRSESVQGKEECHSTLAGKL